MSEEGKDTNLIAGVEEKDLDDFLLSILKIANWIASETDYSPPEEEESQSSEEDELQSSEEEESQYSGEDESQYSEEEESQYSEEESRFSGENKPPILDEDKLKTLIKPMKELFFMKDGKYKDIETLEKRLDIFLEEISKITGKQLYNPDNSNENKNVALQSGYDYENHLNEPFLTEEKKKEYYNSIFCGDEINIKLLWIAIKEFGFEMFLANRRKLRGERQKFEPRHPTSIPLIYHKEAMELFLEWKKYSEDLQKQNKNSAFKKEKIESMVSRGDFDIFYYLIRFYKDYTKEKYANQYYYITLIDSLWKDSANDIGYFKENGINAKSLKHPRKKDKDKIIELAKNFIESYMSSEQAQKKLDNIIAEIEDVRKVMQTKTVRAIHPPGANYKEIIYGSYDGYEDYYYVNFYKKTNVTDQIFKNINELPIGSFVKQLIEEGGTNLTGDSMLSAQFARGANNAFIVTGTAIPVGNLLGLYEMPEILANVSKNADQEKRFAENNPIVPLTNKKPRENIRDSEILYVTGEYMLDQWKKKQIEGKLKTPEDKKKFTEELYNDLKERAVEYMEDTKKLVRLDERLRKVKDIIYRRIKNSAEEHSNAQIFENPEIYKLDEIKTKHLEEAVYKDYTEDTEEKKKENEAKRARAILMNKIALKLQELSLMEDFIAVCEEDMKKFKEIKPTPPIAKRSSSVPPASNLRGNEFSRRRNSFVSREADKKDGLEKNEPKLLE
ncbi:MAG: hypothetical protein LBP39_03895 [Rickettsiales bacterium]|jgi:hypothetical protein|nr:hypothetical protein [Rickettsiales bacterium]